MGFFCAYFGVLMGFHWLAAGQERYSRCIDYYKTGNTTDGKYALEILPRIVVSVYCKDMNTGSPSEYISLAQERNYARYEKLLGLPLDADCLVTGPTQNWEKLGETNFTRIRFNFDSWLVTTNDFTYANSVEGGFHIPYGQVGDTLYNQTNQSRVCGFRGAFEIDLTSTPFEVDPHVTWSSTGPMTNQSVRSSDHRQKVYGLCEGYPGIFFPALPSNQSLTRLKLRFVFSHPCFTSNLCKNLGKCLVRDAVDYECLCLPGSTGLNCEKFLGNDEFDFCAHKSRGNVSVCQNSGTCKSYFKTTTATYGGDGGREACQFPSPWLGKHVTQCVSDCSVGPPFACFLHFGGGSSYVNLGWWSPSIVYTLEGWVSPTAHTSGLAAIMGTFQDCSKMGIALDNGKFALVYKPLTGCSNSSQTGTTGYIDQWHHIAMTVDGTNARLYVNGSLLNTVRTRTAFLFPPEGIRLGNGYSRTTDGFVGNMKSFTVWKRALERAEIFDHYNDPLKDFNTTVKLSAFHRIKFDDCSYSTTSFIIDWRLATILYEVTTRMPRD